MYVIKKISVRVSEQDFDEIDTMGLPNNYSSRVNDNDNMPYNNRVCRYESNV